jgi:hypothetical protein
MTGQMYEIKVTAVGEVRDSDGNLISAEPVEMTKTVTEQELRELTGGTE